MWSLSLCAASLPVCGFQFQAHCFLPKTFMCKNTSILVLHLEERLPQTADLICIQKKEEESFFLRRRSLLRLVLVGLRERAVTENHRMKAVQHEEELKP